MSMFQIFNVAGSAVSAQSQRLNVVASNLANADSATIKQYLEANQAKLVRVPYRMNRCVLFDSTYFHTTDEIHFKEGYENRRINCTLLFGKGL